MLISVSNCDICVWLASSWRSNWDCIAWLLTPAEVIPMTLLMVGAYNWTSVFNRSFKVEMYFAEA